MTAVNDSDAIAPRLESLRGRIAGAQQQYQREPQSVTLLAAAKGQPAEALRAAYQLGVTDFGENYLSEALERRPALSDLADICWHFIGPVQSNKARDIAAAFDWVHTVDRSKIARRLADHRPAGAAPLDICLQVNLGGEAQKSGCAADEVAELAGLCASLPALKLRGLMTLPPQSPDPAKYFTELRALLVQLQAQLPDQQLDTLSMGMSGDFESAIANGSTCVRIGSALFGPRPAASNAKH